MLEVLGAFVPEENAEHLEVDDALEEEADALQKVVWVENAGDLTGDLVEDAEGLGLARDAGVETGVLDGDGHAGADELQEALVFGCEVTECFRLEIEDSDDLVLYDERDGEFGANVGVGVDIVIEHGDVFD